jgi:hypothetical protein
MIDKKIFAVWLNRGRHSVLRLSGQNDCELLENLKKPDQKHRIASPGLLNMRPAKPRMASDLSIDGHPAMGVPYS